MIDDDLPLIIEEFEQLRRDNRLLIGLLHEIIADLRMIVENSIPKAGKMTIKDLKEVKTVKKITVKKLVIEHLDRLEYNLDNIDIEQLSGALNIGITHDYNCDEIGNEKGPPESQPEQ